MTDLATLQPLLALIEAATGPDREIDGALCAIFGRFPALFEACENPAFYSRYLDTVKGEGDESYN